MNKHSIKLNGQEVTRNSKNHVYTHAVVALYQGKPIILRWCGSLELATKSASRSRGLVAKYTPGKPLIYNNVQIVPNGGETTL